MQYATVSYLFDGFADTEIVEPVERKKRNTKAIGDMSELEAALALARAGYIVSKPLGDSYRYDLVIDDGEQLFRVQVKTGRLRRGAVAFNCFSSHTHRGGIACRSYRGEVDYFAVHCPQTGITYLIPEAELVRTKIHLRVDPTGNRQDRNIRWAQRFELP